MSDDTWSLALSPTEYCLLSRLLGSTCLIGLDDPMAGLLADEVEERLGRAEQTLTERGMIAIQPDGGVSLEPGVGAVAGVAAANKESMVITRSGVGGSSSTRVIYPCSKLLVEQETVPEDSVVLTAVRDVITLEQRTAAFLGIRDVQAGPGSPITLSEQSLNEARRLARDQDSGACVEYLGGAGVPAEQSVALASALADEEQAGSVVIVHRSDRELSYGGVLAWIVGRQDGWLLKSLGGGIERRVRIVPASAADIRARLTAMIEALLG